MPQTKRDKLIHAKLNGKTINASTENRNKIYRLVEKYRPSLASRFETKPTKENTRKKELFVKNVNKLIDIDKVRTGTNQGRVKLKIDSKGKISSLE